MAATHNSLGQGERIDVNFTSDLPNKPGFYALKSDDADDAFMLVRVFDAGGQLIVQIAKDGYWNFWMRLNQFNTGLWCQLVPSEEMNVTTTTQ